MPNWDERRLERLVADLSAALEEAMDYIDLVRESSGEDNGENAMLRRFDKVLDRARKRCPGRKENSAE